MAQWRETGLEKDEVLVRNNVPTYLAADIALPSQ